MKDRLQNRRSVVLSSAALEEGEVASSGGSRSAHKDSGGGAPLEEGEVASSDSEGGTPDAPYISITPFHFVSSVRLMLTYSSFW